MNAAGETNNSQNLESFYFRTYQGWYLVGAMTETNTLGILGGNPLGVVN
jgi:basic membrane protein A